MSSSSTEIIINSREEMLSLLFIYCGYLDDHLSDPEIQLIQKRYGLRTYEKMLEAYRIHPKHKILESILSFFNLHYTTYKMRSLLRKDILKLCEADGKICRFEESFLNFFNLYIEKTRA